MIEYLYSSIHCLYFIKRKCITLCLFGLLTHLQAHANQISWLGAEGAAESSRMAYTALADFNAISWSTAASQRYSVSEAQGEVVNGKLYSFGGFDSQKSGFTPTSRAFVYDPSANTWKAIAPMPAMNGTKYGGVTHAGFTTDGTDIYFAGGYTSNAKGTGQIFGAKEVWKYIVAENRYVRLPDLPAAIAAGQLEYLNGKLHHISGTNAARTQDLDDHYVLDLNNLAAGWKTLAPLPDPRQHAGSAILDGNIYYIGGQTGHDSKLTTKKDVHRYDPATDKWKQMADLPVPAGTNGRGHISSSVIVAGNRLLVLGGETSHGTHTSMVSAYTPATNTWQNLTPLPAARYSGVAALLGGNIFYTGGASATTYKGTPQATEDHPYMVLENLDGFPAPDHLAFSNVQVPWHRKGTPFNQNHNKVKLKISNKGTGPLTIKDMSLSDADAWKIDQLNGKDYNATAALPITVKAGSAVVLTIGFIAKDQGDRVKILHDTLYISSNDELVPYKKVQLHGLWQKEGEDVREPWSQEIIHAFGFKTNTGYNHDDGDNNGETIVPNSDEVLSSLFVRADPSRPVEVIQMAAYHGCCSDIERFEWFYPDAAPKTLFIHDNLDGQSLLPRKSNDLTKLAQGAFNPTGAFGFKVGKDYSDRTRNSENKIGMRIWKAVDASGNVIPNAYIIGCDYLGNPYTNYDYQDNVYFVSNVRPEAGTAYYSELTAAPSAVRFGEVPAGSSKKLTVNLTNQGKTYADGSSDPAIQVKNVEITGPDKDSFTTAMPAVATLAVQASTNITVAFKPNSSRGIKNATLLIHYNSAASPLRVPLYGIARDNDTTMVLVKRIKSGADKSITIGGNVWEADKSYRKGSIKLDKQVVTTSIAATDIDTLYQTYLSAATDLAETGYEILIADGNYTVRMHFVENYWSAEAARLFNIIIEDQLRLANFDIYKEAGYRTALVKDFEVRVTDGVLNIKFDPTANRVAIAGLEIFKDSASTNVTGITPDVEAEKRLVQVYPNPAQGEEIQVAVEHFASQEEVTIILYDVLGRVLYKKTLVTDTQGNATAALTMAPSEKGLYIIKADAPSGKAEFKLLIQ